MKQLLLLSGCFFLANFSALAADTYKSEGGVEVHSGDVLAGTAHIGAAQLQPHYLIDLEDESYQSLLRQLRADLGAQKLTPLEKIERATRFVQSHFERTAYDDQAFMRMNLEKIRAGRAIRLSEIIRGGAGVCREHNLLLHLLLKDVGVPTHYLTAKVGSGPSPALLKTEDHSFLTYEPEPKRRIVLDAYFDRFHGQDYNRLTGNGKGPSAGSYLDRNATNQDSIFPRVRREPVETVAVLGERNYEYKLPAGSVEPQTAQLNSAEFAYKLKPGDAAPNAGGGCRKNLLRALLQSLNE